MKKMLAVLVLAGLQMGCTTAQVGLFNRNLRPNQSVVESFVRMGDENGAREYLIRFGIHDTEVIERLQLAREEALKKASR